MLYYTRLETNTLAYRGHLTKDCEYDSRGLYYKTVNGRNLLIFVKKTSVFVFGKPFQPSLMFVGEARSLP